MNESLLKLGMLLAGMLCIGKTSQFFYPIPDRGGKRVVRHRPSFIRAGQKADHTCVVRQSCRTAGIQCLDGAMGKWSKVEVEEMRRILVMLYALDSAVQEWASFDNPSHAPKVLEGKRI